MEGKASLDLLQRPKPTSSSPASTRPTIRDVRGRRVEALLADARRPAQLAAKPFRTPACCRHCRAPAVFARCHRLRVRLLVVDHPRLRVPIWLDLRSLPFQGRSAEKAFAAQIKPRGASWPGRLRPSQTPTLQRKWRGKPISRFFAEPLAEADFRCRHGVDPETSPPRAMGSSEPRAASSTTKRKPFWCTPAARVAMANGAMDSAGSTRSAIWHRGSASSLKMPMPF